MNRLLVNVHISHNLKNPKHQTGQGGRESFNHVLPRDETGCVTRDAVTGYN